MGSAGEEDTGDAQLHIPSGSGATYQDQQIRRRILHTLLTYTCRDIENGPLERDSGDEPNVSDSSDDENSNASISIPA